MNRHNRISRPTLQLNRVFYILLLFSLVTYSFAGQVSATDTTPAPEQIVTHEQGKISPLEEKWGIKITALRLTAAGHMIDFRYRVIDAEKAKPLFVRKTKPYLIHEESGKVLAVPNTAKIGALRNSNIPQENRIYWMFFGNNGLVKKGDNVSIAIGEFKAESLIVL